MRRTAIAALALAIAFAATAKADPTMHALAQACMTDEICVAYAKGVAFQSEMTGFIFGHKLSQLKLTPEQERAVRQAFLDAIKEATQ